MGKISIPTLRFQNKRGGAAFIFFRNFFETPNPRLLIFSNFSREYKEVHK